MDDNNDIFVNSYNQQGGITAGKVFIGNQKRTLTPELKEQLRELVTKDKDKEIKITANLGDGESIQYAEEIKSFLEAEGWKISGVNQAVSMPHATGQSINSDGDNIRIGSKK